MKSTIQRLFSICLSFTMVVTLIPKTVFAEEWQTEPETLMAKWDDSFEVDNIRYEVTKEAEGNAMGEVAVCERQDENITEVTIPNTVIDPNDSSKIYAVTSIGITAFMECSNLKSVDLSDCKNLRIIDQSAFSSCTSLTKIDLSNCSNLKTIAWNAFGKSGLEEITLTNSITEIGSSAFNNCTSLESIDLSKCSNLTTIGENTFTDCASLESIDLSNCSNLTTIGSNDFEGCTSLDSVALPKSVSEILMSAFSGCTSLKSIDLTDCRNLSMINGYAFSGCKSLESIDLSNCRNLSTIFDGAFSGCTSLKSVVLPEGLTTIKNKAFDLGTGATIKVMNIPSTVKQIGSNFLSGTTNQTKLIFQGQERPTMDALAFAKITANTQPVIYFPATLNAINSYADVNSLFVKEGLVENVQVCPGRSINISDDLNGHENLINTNLNIAKIESGKITGLKEGNAKIATSLNMVVNGIKSEYVNQAWNIEVSHFWKQTGNSNIWKCTLCNETYTGTTPPTGGSSSGGSGGSVSKPTNPTQEVKNAVYRAYNPNNGEHLYTTNYGEFKHITRIGWDDEGIAFMTEATQGNPLYRVYNPNNGLHHYTIDSNEKNRLVALGWRNEGVAFYISKNPQSMPVYRIYNPNGGQHHYTMDANEALALISMGWDNEGIAFFTSPIEK